MVLLAEGEEFSQELVVLEDVGMVILLAKVEVLVVGVAFVKVVEEHQQVVLVVHQVVQEEVTLGLQEEVVVAGVHLVVLGEVTQVLEEEKQFV